MINIRDLNKQMKCIVSELKSVSLARTDESFSERISELEQDIDGGCFRISVVGEFSSGKSTFLNALIGKDILPHGVKETTATLTRIYNVKAGDSRIDTAVINFRDVQKEPLRLDLGKNKNELIDYVTTSEKRFNVAKEIESVDIFVNFAGTDEQVVLIDTPGMNGVADGHKEITLNEIKHSHASICLFHIRGIGNSDLMFIRQLMQHQDAFFFVLNQIDDLKSEEENAEDRIKTFAAEIKNSLYEGKAEPRHVFGISALKAIAARDKDILRLYSSDDHDLTPREKKRILEESRIEILERELFNFLNNSDKEKEYFASICNRLLALARRSSKTATDSKDILEADVNNIPGKDKIERLVSKAEENTAKFKINMSATLNALISDLQKDVYDDIKKRTSAKCDELTDSINSGYQSLEEVEKANNVNLIGKSIETFWCGELIYFKDSLQSGMERIQETFFEEMENVLPEISIGKDKKIMIEQPSFDSSEDFQIDSALKSLERKKQEMLQRQSSNQENSERIQGKLDETSQQLKTIDDAKRRALNNLGTRPGVGTIEIERRIKKTGLLNTFKSLWGEDEYETIYETKPDYSEQRAWESKKQETENSYNAKILNLKGQRSSLEKMLNQVRDNEKTFEAQLRRINSEIDEERRKADELKKIAKSSYIKSVKNSWKTKVDELLGDGGELSADLRSGVRDYLEKSKNPVREYLSKILDEKKIEYVGKLNLMLQKLEAESNVESSKNEIALLSADIDKLTEIETKITNIKNEL